MMNDKAENKPLTEQDKQTQPMPGEIDPRNSKVEVFLAMQKVKAKLKVKK